MLQDYRTNALHSILAKSFILWKRKWCAN